MEAIDVIFTGLLRTPELFQASLADLAALRRRGVVGRVIFATWPSEDLGAPALHSALDAAAVEVITSEPPAQGPGNIWHQMKSLELGLAAVDRRTRVLKTRTDLHIVPAFIEHLAAGGISLAKLYGGTPGSLGEKIWLPWFEITKPGYMADECMFGRATDLKRLVNFDNSYDRPEWGIDAGITHLRRFLHPFRPYHPRLDEYLENFAATGHNTPARYPVLSHDMTTPYFWEYLAEYYRIVEENFHVETWADKPHISCRKWSQPLITIDDEAMAENFHPAKSWNPYGGQIYAYNLHWLQALLSGRFLGKDACADAFYAALERVRQAPVVFASDERRQALAALRVTRRRLLTAPA